MTGDHDAWLATIPAGAGRGDVLLRAGQRVHAGLRLGDLVRRRPPGVTGHQWNVASRSRLDLVVCAEGTDRVEFAVEFRPPSLDAAARRSERVMAAVTAAVGLPVLRLVSTTLTAAEHGPGIVTYLLDARRYAEGAVGADVAAVGFRDIVGRLPDGRTGAVNDLGALARADAVQAYVARRLADPILRGLHVRWAAGPAEGWAWVEVRPGECLVERVSLHADRLSCGVDPARLAEDLAVLAVGDQLRRLDAGIPVLVGRPELIGDIRRLRERRHELADDFAYDHLCQV
ncbi:DUF2726 domain-containing protein [Micromonospora zingiberis]|uniref:DUF2726 domain-containing protein n=1 Tax=Micromonospora zingiberis TaxID=2053011 RepID=A0A4R0GBB0_9ACTN|nr:DUF2726 domain-containing protein [Micromonospora zingiberis]TCB94374.1 DUF2726 domain-containing protein [Micromonospora zingiberis]